MAHREPQKPTTAPLSSTPAQVVVEAEAMDHVRDADFDPSWVMDELESLVSDKAEWKAELEAKFGSMEAANACAMEIPAVRKKIEDTLEAWQELIYSEIKKITSQLADIQYWKVLAKSDPKQFRRQNAKVLRTYKGWLNLACGIKPHRSRNDAQNVVIYEIKSSKPKWSFGRVAYEYTRRTGKPMTAKTAERTYKRTCERSKAGADFILDFGAELLLSSWKSSLTTTKA
jgi:hypothetical protein